MKIETKVEMKINENKPKIQIKRTIKMLNIQINSKIRMTNKHEIHQK